MKESIHSVVLVDKTFKIPTVKSFGYNTDYIFVLISVLLCGWQCIHRWCGAAGDCRLETQRFPTHFFFLLHECVYFPVTVLTLPDTRLSESNSSK
jgi:hypothetical protein